ncbi:MAG: glycogen synthase GlgA [Deltaproteobacteria bacterium]|nr:glycogen synthase GlgA [Deltaproteobacteria bacterium]
MKEDKLRILFLSPEAAPFAKSGGLADVAGSLPPALKRYGADVRLVLPLYTAVRHGEFALKPLIRDLEVPLGGRTLGAGVMRTRTRSGVPVYLIEREDLYERPGLYGDRRGDYYDNLERFSFFSHAALRLAEKIDFRPHIVHCHDWQTGLAPALIKGPYRNSPAVGGAATVFTIHNIGYQGLFPADRLFVTGLSEGDVFHPDGLEYWGDFSLLKSGIVYSEAITTVSPTYAREVRTREYGRGMEGVLEKRRNHLHGILNGVDYSVWNPAKDPYLPARFSPKRLSGKAICKKALIHEMGLDASLFDKPLLGMITRLNVQKGLDLLLQTLGSLRALDAGLVVLGVGDPGIEKSLLRLAKRRAGRMGVRIGFDEPLAHRIMAGADALLVPSRYEPCGLTQLYALKYGTVPIVRATGGLNDTIVSYNPKSGEGNGFKFDAYEARAFTGAIRSALRLFQEKKQWAAIGKNGMAADFSWKKSARRYMDLYRSLAKQPL